MLLVSRFKKSFFSVLLCIFQLQAEGSVVLLQGTSSAGKTTLALELQKQLQEPWSIVSIDDFVYPAVFATAQRLGLISPNTMAEAEIHQLISASIGMILATFDQTTTGAISWGSIKKEMYLSVLQRVLSGERIILDTVLSCHEFLETSDFMQIMQAVTIYRVLVYCSPLVLIEHVTKRNNSIDYTQHRDAERVVKSFCDMYERASNPESQVDVITRTAVDGLTDNLATISTLLRDTFHLDAYEFAEIASKCSCEMLVNTGTMSNEDCARAICCFIGLK